MPLSKKRLIETTANVRCSICSRAFSVVVCRNCLKTNQLAGFCDKCKYKHGAERLHGSDFVTIDRQTIRRLVRMLAGQ